MKLKGNLKFIMIFFILLILVAIFKSGKLITMNDSVESSTTLPIPPLLEDQNPDLNISNFILEPQEGVTIFRERIKTNTLGYNGSYLGPVIRVKKGEEVNITINNKLNEGTTVHWHGLEIGGDVDGGPHQEISAQSAEKVSFTVNQPAATLWYHPHLIGSTASQVYRGLAGLFYIEDEVSEKLNIPKDYGINDIPLVIQDRSFNSDGSLTYDENTMHAGLGDTVLVNGAILPNLDVSTVKMRFRVVNGSNEKSYNFKLSDGAEMIQIASDGGFLENPTNLNYLFLSPGERAEVIIDFSKYKVGNQVSLMNSNGQQIISYTVKDKKEDSTEIPQTLTQIDRLEESEVTTVRTFSLTGMGHMSAINGQQFDMMRIDESIEVGDTEIWEITNPIKQMHRMGHPFHIHGAQFQVLSVNGEEPNAQQSGWKDTIYVNPGDTIKIIIKFNYQGVYMYHCHILSHEEAGMMGQAKVE